MQGTPWSRRRYTPGSANELRIADPFILPIQNTPRWYAFGTGFARAKSDDYGNTWTPVTAPMFTRATKPVDVTRPWALEVHRIGGKFVAYISASGKGEAQASIYAAKSAGPDPTTGYGNLRRVVGPGRYPKKYRPKRDGKRNTRFSQIDATVARANGKLYLVWKEDRAMAKRGARESRKGRKARLRAGTKRIIGQRLRKDGVTTVGKPFVMLTAGKKSDRWINKRGRKGPASVEAPTIIRVGKLYYMFYSVAGYKVGTGYAVGVATSKSMKGPWKRQKKLVLRSGKTFTEPGHQSVVPVTDAAGKTHFIIYYHAHAPGRGEERYLMRDELRFGRKGGVRSFTAG